MSFRPFQPFRAFGGGAALDPDVAAFVAASGATDIATLNALSVYLKTQSLWTSCRFFSFKSAQNKGSGTTVYGIGGWTSNNMALVNGPTWGAGGVAFDATDDRGTWPGTGIEALSELYIFDRQKPTNASLADTARFGVVSVGDANSPQKFFFTGGATGVLSDETLAAGLTNETDVRRFGTTQTWSAGADTQIVTRFAQTGYDIWKSKATTTKASPFPSGTSDFRPSQAGWTSNSTVNVNSLWFNLSGYSGFISTTRVSLLFCKTSLTQTQREAITDYLDAL
jgi:hypothetical protein